MLILYTTSYKFYFKVCQLNTTSPKSFFIYWQSYNTSRQFLLESFTVPPITGVNIKLHVPVCLALKTFTRNEIQLWPFVLYASTVFLLNENAWKYWEKKYELTVMQLTVMVMN
jgi:hypothetical protein